MTDEITDAQFAQKDRILRELEEEIAQLFIKYCTQLPLDARPMVAVEFSKYAAHQGAAVIVAYFGLNIDNDALIREVTVDIARYVKMAAKSKPGSKVSLEAIRFIEKLQKRSMQ